MSEEISEFPNLYTSTTVDASVVISDHFLQAVMCINTSGSTIFLHFFDATSLPSNGATPILRMQVGTVVQKDFCFASLGSAGGLHAHNGWVIASSSTRDTLTINTANVALSVMSV